MTIHELKSHAYDCMANIEFWQKELQATNQKISQEVTKEAQKEEPKEEPEEKK